MSETIRDTPGSLLIQHGSYQWVSLEDQPSLRSGEPRCAVGLSRTRDKRPGLCGCLLRAPAVPPYRYPEGSSRVPCHQPGSRAQRLLRRRCRPADREGSPPSAASCAVDEISGLRRIAATFAFLVTAKGLVRSEEFEKSRDFTEYFLIGSLSSVLVALCAGLALRYALLALWPDLLVLQMQQ
jgi:hypothetical protein